MPRFPARAAALVGWAVLATFQFGFGVSELNGVHESLTCDTGSACGGLSDSAFGTVTAMFTLGGTLSSLSCSALARALRLSHRAMLGAAAELSLAGALVLASAHSALAIGAARLIQGLAAGLAATLVPVVLADLAPPAIRGSVGVLNQLAIVSGIFCAQLLGTLAPPGGAWRHVPLASAAVAAVQLGGLPWARAPASPDERDAMWHYAAVPRDPEDASSPAPATPPTALPHGLAVILLTQLAQQLSGVNAILYYSTGILAGVLHGAARYVGVAITVVNALMSLPPLVLIDEHRVGRKRLLVGSAAGMGASCLVLAYSLAARAQVLSALAITAAIACFAVGLGPVPFVIMPEVVPRDAAAHAASLGIAANWITNAAVALAFPPLRAAFAPLDGASGALVFVLFGCINLASAALIAQRYTYTI